MKILKLFLVLCVLIACVPTLASPVVFWQSSPVSPGQTVLTEGSDLAGVTSVSVLPVSGGSAQSATIVQQSATSIKFTVPSSLNFGIYNVTYTGSTGTTSFYVNAPQILWTQGDSGNFATKNGTIRLLGNCLTNGISVPQVSAISSGTTINLHVVNYSSNSVTVAIPSSFPSGVYTLKYNQSSNSTYTITTSVSISSGNAYTASVSLSPNGLDDTSNINAALTTLASTGGTLNLSAGTFNISSTLNIPVNVSIVGKQRNRTILNWTTATPPTYLILGTHDFSVKNLTIQSVAYYDGISNSITSSIGNVTITGVNLIRVGTASSSAAILQNTNPSTSNHGDSIALGGSNLQVSDCYVDASARPIALYAATNSWVHDNVFNNRENGWYCLGGSNGLIFENNTVQGVTSTSSGGGINTLQGNGSCSKNVYFSDNTLENFVNGQGEGMTTDGGGGVYIGTLASVDNTTVTLSGTISPTYTGLSPIGCAVWVLSGVAQGEMRQVVTNPTTSTVTIDSAFNPAPAFGDTISISPLQENYIVVSNSFYDTGLMVQLYGSSYNTYIANNTGVNCGDANNAGRLYQSGLQPSWYTQWIGNTLSGRQAEYVAQVGSPGLQVNAMPGGLSLNVPYTLGTVVRNNTLVNSPGYTTEIEVGYNGFLPAYAYTQDTLIEGNYFPTGIPTVLAYQSGTYVGINTGN